MRVCNGDNLNDENSGSWNPSGQSLEAFSYAEALDDDSSSSVEAGAEAGDNSYGFGY